ncbi:hypothetical protein [Putridiphycobacter roseus]|uniref:hypothetical protein n=1 Tax=Putridiphycobacter roseus TaxID=2219161 RepID=UPI0011B6F965|nr:hypothetical protein [Putridiphycobacter roseus]
MHNISVFTLLTIMSETFNRSLTLWSPSKNSSISISSTTIAIVDRLMLQSYNFNALSSFTFYTQGSSSIIAFLSDCT